MISLQNGIKHIMQIAIMSKYFINLEIPFTLIPPQSFARVNRIEINTGIRIIRNRIIATAVEYPVRLP